MYCTKQDMVDRFSANELQQLTDDHHTGSIDDKKLDRSIADATALIDGYIGSRYTLPLSSIPTVLVKPACDIARHALYDDNVTDLVQKNYDNAIKLLRDVQSGKATLGDDEGTENNIGGSMKTAQGQSKHDWETY